MSNNDKTKPGLQNWGLLAAALALGVIAFFASNWYLQSREQALANELLSQQEERRDVVVATMDLVPGAQVSGANMAVAQVSAGHLSASVVTPDQFDSFAERVLVTPMSRGEPLLSHFVAGEFAERFSDLLLEGERAVTLPVDEIKSNDGMLTFGDRVDLLLLVERRDHEGMSGPNQALHPLVQNVRVLATGQTALATRGSDLSLVEDDGMGMSSYATVTVGVSAEHAAHLLLAKDMGSVVVLLRNRRDELPLEASSLSAEGLLSGQTQDAYEYFAGSLVEGGGLRPQSRQVVRSAKPRSAEAQPLELRPASEPAAAPSPDAPN